MKGRPPIPIPENLLDPRSLQGYQPSPHDIRYHNNPGKTFELENNVRGQGCRAESEYVSEWCVKILPPQETLLAVAAGEGFGVKAQLLVRHFGDQFLEYQPIVQQNTVALEIPLFGQCVGVHGRSIDLNIYREAVGAAGKLIMQAAIVPGRPSFSFFNRSLSVAGGLGVNNLVAIPTFATRFQINGQLDPGDVIRMVVPSGLGTVQVIPVAELGQLLPLHPSAAFVSYSSAVNKELAVGFEIYS